MKNYGWLVDVSIEFCPEYQNNELSEGNKVGKILVKDLADEIKREVTRKCRREREI